MKSSLPKYGNFSLILIFIFSLFFIQCENEKVSKPTSNAVGYISEINITTDDETAKYLRDALLNSLAAPQEYLSPAEPFYKLNFIGIDNFAVGYLEYQLQVIIITSENIDQMKHLNKLFEKKTFDSLCNESSVSVVKRKNIWAINQTIFFVFAPNAETVRLYLRDKGSLLKNDIYQTEIKDFIARTGEKNHSLANIIREKHSIYMRIPKFFNLDINKQNYYSAIWEEGDAICNLLINILPDSPVINHGKAEQMLAQRKIDGQKHLQMDTVGLYIGTSQNFFQDYTPYQINGFKGGKINGWWVIEGMFRGGPYTRYTIYLPKIKKWVALEALVYYPNLENKNQGKTKTRYLRTIESIIHSIKEI